MDRLEFSERPSFVTPGGPMSWTLDEFRERLWLVFEENERAGAPDTMLRTVLCEADRLAAEYAEQLHFVTDDLKDPPWVGDLDGPDRKDVVVSLKMKKR